MLLGDKELSRFETAPYLHPYIRLLFNKSMHCGSFTVSGYSYKVRT